MLDQDKTTEQLIAELHNLEKLVEARTADLTALKNQLQQEIEQHKAIEETLKLNEGHILSVIENAHDAIITTDHQGIITYWNTTASRIYGYASEEMVGQPVFNIIPKRFINTHQHKAQEVVSSASLAKPTRMANLTGLKKDGTEFPAELSVSFWESSAGTSATAIIRDISERKAAERNLLESEARFRNLVESSTDAIVLVNDAGEIFFCNNSAALVFGYSKDEVVGMPLKNIVGPHDAHQQAFTRFQTNNSSLLSQKTFESQAVRKNGQVFPVELSVSFWKTLTGGVYGAIIRDITQRKLTEESLRRSELQYRSVVETSSDAIITANSQNKIVSWNKGAETVFGYTADEIINKSIFSLVPERLHALHTMRIAELTSDMSSTALLAKNSSWGIKKDGTEFLAESSASKWGIQNELFMTITLRDVTKREQTIKALQTSEEQFRSLVDTASDAIITTDLQGTIITWNKGAENIYGYSADEIINKSFIVLFPEHFTLVNQNQRLKHFAQHNLGIIFQDTQIPAKRKDGREFQAEGSVSKWESTEGIFLTALVRDITERKQAEEALRRSEIQYRSVIETASDAIITTDSAGIIVGWNNGAEQIFGYSADEIMNKPYLTLMPERLHAKYQQRLKGFDENLNNIQRGESFGRRKDGSEFSAEGSLTMWKTNEDVFITTTARDISDRKRAEEALRQSEERYRLTADMVPIHLGATDQSYKYYLWNKYSAKMFGYTQEEALNKLSFLDIHEKAEEAQEVFDTALNTGIFDKELRFRRKNGSLFPAHLIVVPDRDSEGNVKGLYVFAEDITMRRKAEHIVSQVDDCLLSLTPDPDSNIQHLVESAGKILGGDCSAYHSIRGLLLNIKAEWNVPVVH